ncbi:MAG: hypothetical protein BMS9Abin33_0975 [Gammaproteobacteria bacterium]|nr:MAG: hypothetical protein BMS9Abin33_0975 [Gammaproteobacteria bacterium]
MGRTFIILLIGIGLLTACATAPVDKEDTSYYLPPLGSALVVKQSFEIRANKASAWFQGGRLRPFSEVDLYYPNCKFELRTLSDAPRTIKPGRFTIIRIVQEVDVMSWPVRVASADNRLAGVSIGMGVGHGAHVGVGVGIGHGTSASLGPDPYATVFYLQSAEQPDVFRLTCMHWEELYEARYLTMREIRSTVNDVMVFEITP